MTKKQRSNARNARINLFCESLERRELMAADLGVSVPVDLGMESGIASLVSEANPSIRTNKIDSTFDHALVGQGPSSHSGLAEEALTRAAAVPAEPATDLGDAQLPDKSNPQAVIQDIKSTMDQAIVDQGIPSDMSVADDFSNGAVSIPVGPATYQGTADSSAVNSPIHSSNVRATLDLPFVDQGFPQDTGTIDRYFGGYCGVGTWVRSPQ